MKFTVLLSQSDQRRVLRLSCLQALRSTQSKIWEQHRYYTQRNGLEPICCYVDTVTPVAKVMSVLL